MTEELLFSDLQLKKLKNKRPKHKMMINQIWFAFICGHQFTEVYSLPESKQKHGERLPGATGQKKQISFCVTTLSDHQILKKTIRKKALELLNNALG